MSMFELSDIVHRVVSFIDILGIAAGAQFVNRCFCRESCSLLGTEFVLILVATGNNEPHRSLFGVAKLHLAGLRLEIVASSVIGVSPTSERSSSGLSMYFCARALALHRKFPQLRSTDIFVNDGPACEFDRTTDQLVRLNRQLTKHDLIRAMLTEAFSSPCESSTANAIPSNRFPVGGSPLFCVVHDEQLERYRPCPVTVFVADLYEHLRDMRFRKNTSGHTAHPGSNQRESESGASNAGWLHRLGSGAQRAIGALSCSMFAQRPVPGSLVDSRALEILEGLARYTVTKLVRPAYFVMDHAHNALMTKKMFFPESQDDSSQHRAHPLVNCDDSAFTLDAPDELQRPRPAAPVGVGYEHFPAPGAARALEPYGVPVALPGWLLPWHLRGEDDQNPLERHASNALVPVVYVGGRSRSHHRHGDSRSSADASPGFMIYSRLGETLQALLDDAALLHGGCADGLQLKGSVKPFCHESVETTTTTESLLPVASLPTELWIPRCVRDHIESHARSARFSTPMRLDNLVPTIHFSQGCNPVPRGPTTKTIHDKWLYQISGNALLEFFHGGGDTVLNLRIQAQEYIHILPGTSYRLTPDHFFDDFTSIVLEISE